MGTVSHKNKFKINICFILIILCLFIPSLIWSAGYQEEKLFDGDFYSSEDLRQKIENHKREIQVFDNQIKVLEKSIDWMILKINQIQDSGRTASSELKESILKSEEKISTFTKSKNRLEYLVQYYSKTLGPSRKQNFAKPIIQKKEKIHVENILPGKNLYEQGKINKTDLQAEINKHRLNDWVEIIRTGTCLRIETTLPILFSTGSAKVANEYKSFFKKLAQFLRSYDVKILVNGYADTVPIHNKKYPSNFELGATRAANIVHQFINYGLKPSIFRIESTGKYRFAAKGMSKQKSFERRADVTVIFSG